MYAGKTDCHGTLVNQNNVGRFLAPINCSFTKPIKLFPRIDEFSHHSSSEKKTLFNDKVLSNFISRNLRVSYIP